MIGTGVTVAGLIVYGWLAGSIALAGLLCVLWAIITGAVARQLPGLHPVLAKSGPDREATGLLPPKLTGS